MKALVGLTTQGIVCLIDIPTEVAGSGDDSGEESTAGLVLLDSRTFLNSSCTTAIISKAVQTCQSIDL
jgi:hypothetical protein